MRTIKGPDGWKLELDEKEIYPDDPGQGTPALVVAPNGDTGTYWCVCAEGEIICGRNPQSIPQNVSEWLEGLEETVNQFIENKGAD